jgi:cobalt-zinc-cadmium efflux system protein
MLRDITGVLMEGCPATIDDAEIQNALLSIEGVQRVEDLHIWALLPGTNCLTVRLKITSVASHAAVLIQAREAIQAMRQLAHSTIEIERHTPIYLKL